MRWLTIDIFIAIFDDICFYGDSGRRTDECLKRIKMIVSRCQHVCFAGTQCRSSSDSWQNKSHQSDIFCKRLVADFFASNIPRNKGQLLQAFVNRTNHQCKILWKRPLRGLDKQYIRRLFFKKKTMKKRMKLSASRIKLEEEEHN